MFRKIILVTTGEHRYIMILKETDDSVQKEKKNVEAYTTKDGKKYQALT